MTDEIDVLKRAIAEHEKALHLKNLNVELNSHLTGSVYWLLRYSEKYDIPLPKKDDLLRMLEKSDFMINRIISISKKETPNLNKKNFDDETPTDDQNLMARTGKISRFDSFNIDKNKECTSK